MVCRSPVLQSQLLSLSTMRISHVRCSERRASIAWADQADQSAADALG